MNDVLHGLAEKLGRELQGKGLKVVTAESCTGGGIAAALTEVAGSSAWFERGFVTYSNESKQELLGVAGASLVAHGAVSEAVVREMAKGALGHSRGDLVVAVTGIAGPDGGTPAKPVGTVWIAWLLRGYAVRAEKFHFAGDRAAVRKATVRAALEGMLSELTEF